MALLFFLQSWCAEAIAPGIFPSGIQINDAIILCEITSCSEMQVKQRSRGLFNCVILYTGVVLARGQLCIRMRLTMPNLVKHTVYLPADFVRELQRQSLERSPSSYGVVQAFLRKAVTQAIHEWAKRQEKAGGISPEFLTGMAWVRVPAKEAQIYEKLVRYLEAPAATPEEREWKQAVKRVAHVFINH